MEKPTAEEIIRDYEESSRRIRAIIREYERTEHAIFQIMLNKIKALDSKNPDQAQVGSELTRALD